MSTTARAERGTHRRLREEVAALHGHLVRYQLVTWTAGNVSARVPGEDLFVIKASGVDYESLDWRGVVVCDLDGNLVDGEHGPSSDTAAHAFVYRSREDVGGQVHTHSTFACAWAAREEPIPCVLTMQADEFGGDIPLGPFALIGDDSIGRGIVETLEGSRSTAVIMAKHGPFTVGATAKAAVKSAVMCEDVAKATWYAAQGPNPPARIDEESITKLYERYHHVYGQR